MYIHKKKNIHISLCIYIPIAHKNIEDYAPILSLSNFANLMSIYKGRTPLLSASN